MKTGNDGTSAALPGLEISGNETLIAAEAEIRVSGDEAAQQTGR